MMRATFVTILGLGAYSLRPNGFGGVSSSAGSETGQITRAASYQNVASEASTGAMAYNSFYEWLHLLTQEEISSGQKLFIKQLKL